MLAILTVKDFDFGEQTYVATSTPEVIETEIEVDALEERIKAAQEAKIADIEAKAQEAYDRAYSHEMTLIEASVVSDYKAEIQARETELKKQIGVYWKSKANIKRLIVETFPEDASTALAIAKCESGLNPDAYNPKNKNGSVDRGLFQVNSVHDNRLEALGLDPWNPEDNAVFARMLYEENGWLPWVCAWHKDHLALNV